MTRSLRTRLLVGIIGGMTLLLIIFSIIIHTVISRALLRQFDTSLVSTAQMLAASVEQDDGKIEMEFEDQQMPEFQSNKHAIYYQLWSLDGIIIAKSPSLDTDVLPLFGGSLGEPVIQPLELKNGQPGRAVGLKFRPRIADSDDKDYRQRKKGQALTLVVAKDAGDLQYQLRFLSSLLLIASVATITLSFLVAALVVRQGLRPLNSIAVEIAAIREDNLTARIGAEHVPTEIAPIKNRLNELLSRLEASFDRERRFSADVAHELRTPLAGIRSTIEVTLAHVRDANQYKTALSDCLAIVEVMQTMVNNLLMIARFDACQATSRQEEIRLAEMVNFCWRSFSERALQRSILFENRVPAGITCESDSDNLSIVLSNLLHNAVEYADKAGRIWTTAQKVPASASLDVSRGSRDDSVEITVANTGCKLTRKEVSQVFDCFWRGDSSREDAGVHCGLGLALVQRIIRTLGGSVIAELQAGGVFLVRITLPVRRE